MIGLGLGVTMQRRAGAAFSPLSLFANGEQGVWYDPSPTTCFTDTSGTTPAGVGDAVARMNDLSGNGNHATQETVAARPTLQQTAGGLWYLDFDGVDDFLPTRTVGATTNEVCISYEPTGANFVMKFATISGGQYFGVGQSGSSNTTLSGAESSPRAEYWNNVLFTGTTRGENYTAGQSSNVWLGRSAGYRSDLNVKLGAYSPSTPDPRRCYSYFGRDGQMTDDQRAKLAAHMAEKAGVTL